MRETQRRNEMKKKNDKRSISTDTDTSQNAADESIQRSFASAVIDGDSFSLVASVSAFPLLQRPHRRQ